MKKYVLAIVTFMSLSVVAMEIRDENQSSHKTKEFAPHPYTVPFRHVQHNLHGSSLSKDGISPVIEAILLASYSQSPMQSMR